MSVAVIDITDLVEKTRSTFVDWGVLVIFGEEVQIPGLEWVALPIIKDVDQEIIRLVLDAISKQAVMQGFFFNTALRKASQAGDFVDSVNAINALPDNVSDEDYDKLEKVRMDNFRNFVTLGN